METNPEGAKASMTSREQNNYEMCLSGTLLVFPSLGKAIDWKIKPGFKEHRDPSEVQHN